MKTPYSHFSPTGFLGQVCPLCPRLAPWSNKTNVFYPLDSFSSHTWRPPKSPGGYFVVLPVGAPRRPVLDSREGTVGLVQVSMGTVGAHMLYFFRPSGGEWELKCLVPSYVRTYIHTLVPSRLPPRKKIDSSGVGLPDQCYGNWAPPWFEIAHPMT